MRSIHVRARLDQQGITTVKILITHPMESGQKADAQNAQERPAHYIQEILVEHQGREVLRADWGPYVARNPQLSCKFIGAIRGDNLKVVWYDNQGNSDSAETKIA